MALITSDLISKKAFRYWFLAIILSAVTVGEVWAQTTYYSRSSGNWNTNTTWSTVGYGSAINTGNFPVAGDIVFIGGARTVTVTVAAASASVSFDAGTSVTNTLALNSGISLTVSGTITIPQTINGGSNILTVGAGSLVAGNVDFTSSVNGAGHLVSISTGTATINGNISGIGSSSTIAFTDTGILSVSGAFFAQSEGTVTTVAGSTIVYSGSSAQTIQSHAYANLQINGSGVKTFGGTTTTVGGNLIIDTGSTLIIPGVSLFVDGVTTINGSLSFTSITGSKRFSGLVTVTGAWLNTGGESITFLGGITNNGTFTSGNGIYTFSTNSQSLTGNFIIRTVNVSGSSIVLTNNNALQVNLSLTGTGTLAQAPGAILTLLGSSGIANISASASNNLVNYSGLSNQIVKDINYYHLGFSGGGTKILQAATTSIAGNLTLNGTATSTAVTGLTIGGTVNVDAGSTFVAGPFLHVLGGDWITNGTFTHSDGTIRFNGSNQSITGTSALFHNIEFSGSGTKTLATTSTLSGSLSINTGVAVNLSGINTHEANSLVLNGILQLATGTWGATGSGAANINNTYFTGTGLVNVLTGGNTFYSRTTGDWNDNTTWSTIGFGGAAASSPPTVSDFVIIGNGNSVTVTADAACNALAFDPGTNVTNTLAINSGVTLSVTEAVSIPQTISGGSNILAVGAGNIVAGDLNLSASPGGSGHQVTINTGSVTIARNISGVGASSAITFSGAGSLFVGGTFFAEGEGILTTVPGSIVEYNGSAAQTVQSHNYANLSISGSGVKTFGGTSTTLNGDLTVGSGSTLVIPGVSLTVSGITTIEGALQFTSAVGTKQFVGLVTVNGNWSNSGNEAISFMGGISNNGSFSAGTGIYTFSVNSQQLSGDFIFRTLTVNSVVLTNTNSVTVNLSLSGTGTFAQGSGSTLNLGGTSTITNLDATSSDNTVNYVSASDQTIKGGNYFNLGLSGGGIKTLQISTTNVLGDLTLSGTVASTCVTSLTIDGSVSIGSGTSFTAGSFNHAVAGNWTNAGSFSSAGAILLNGADQSVSLSSGTFNDLTLSGTGTKSFLTPVVISDALTIDNGVILSLAGVTTHQAGILVLGGAIQPSNGTWGGLGSGATNVNTVYFSADGGWIDILNGGNMFYSRISGDWSDPATWSNSGFDGTPSLTVPTASDIVQIGNGRAITLTGPGFCKDINFTADTGLTNTLSIDGGGALQVAETITIPQTVTSGSNSLNVINGSVQAVDLAFTPSSGGDHNLTIALGNALFTGNVTGSGTSSIVEFTDAGFLSVGGTFFTASEGTLITTTGSTVEYSGAGNQTIQSHTYHNLVTSGSGNKTLTGTISVLGNLSVGIGTTLIVPGVNLAVSGTTSVDGAISLSTSNSGSKSFTGLVTVNGSWTNPINESIVLRGGLTNNGTFSAGTGTYTFNTNSQVLTGTFVIPRVTVTGAAVALTNSNNLTVSTALAGTGRLTQGSGAVLTVRGTSTITNLTATAASNTVNYSGTNQTIKGVPYYNLYLSGSGVKTFQAGTTAISGDLILSGTVSTASFPSLTIAGNLDIGTGTTLTSPALIQLGGNFIDAGTFVHSSGTILLNGTVDQTLSGVSITGFYNLTVANAAAAKLVTVESSKNLFNVLTLGDNITFDADGSGTAEFSLMSMSGTSTEDGTIAAIPASSSVQGVVRVERRMSPKVNVYRYISAPVQGVALSQFIDDMQAIRQSIRWYNESLVNVENRWRGLASNVTVLDPGKGYQVWMYQNTELLWDVKGNVNQGSFTWSTANGRLTSSTSTTFTEGDKWNLIGNPYPSSIRWDGNASNWTITENEVVSTIYVNDEGGQGTIAYNYFDGSGDDGSGGTVFPVLQDGVVATGQSFWVYVLPGASITIHETAKVPSNSGYEFYRKGTSQLNQLTMRLGHNGGRDEAYFKLNKESTRELDLKLDAPKLFNENMNIYFVDDLNRAMGMHTLPDIDSDSEIRMGFKVTEPGVYTFTAGFKGGDMDQMKDWYFIDRETNLRVRLADLNNLEVKISEGNLSGTDRFVLMKSSNSTTETTIRLYPNPVTTVVNVYSSSVINALEIVDLQGNRVAVQQGLLDSNSASVDVLDLKSGFYILKITTKHGIRSEKFIKK